MTEAVITFNSLKKQFGSTQVLKGISSTIERGEVIGLLGLNGSGKTTLLETALGFSLPTSGNALVFGNDSAVMADASIKAKIGYVPQQDELLDSLKPKRYLELVASFYKHWNWELVNRLLKEWNVPLDKRVNSLSVGQRQKLSILSALGHEPELLVLDEPVASMDPLARRQFIKEIIEIASGHDRTILFSTHIVSDLERVATRVWLIKDGFVIVDEELDVLKESTVRIHLPANTNLPTEILEDRTILRRQEQNQLVLVFTRWDERIKEKLEAYTGITVEPERLSLEDIFLEVHA